MSLQELVDEVNTMMRECKSSNYARLAGIDRHRRDGDKRCPNDRPFVCYVFDELHQEYPAWLKQRGDDSDEDQLKCGPCTVKKSQPCQDPLPLSSNLVLGRRPRVDNCHPKFCTSADKENPQLQHGLRVKRQGSSLPSVSYPRCIKTDGLPEDQKAIVQTDGLLDCEKNPFYTELGLESLTVAKLQLCSAVDPDKIDRDLPMVVACSVNGLMVIAIALAWYIRFGRPEKDDDDDDDEEMDSHSRKHDSSKKKTGDDDDA
ncbi:unnamed protein product, partial [Mesorhabditis spiculigera]